MSNEHKPQPCKDVVKASQDHAKSRANDMRDEAAKLRTSGRHTAADQLERAAKARENGSLDYDREIPWYNTAWDYD